MGRTTLHTPRRKFLATSLVGSMSYNGDWYLLRAKLTNDSSCFVVVREVGVRWAMERCARSEGVERGDGDRKPVCTYFGKRSAKVLSRLF